MKHRRSTSSNSWYDFWAFWNYNRLMHFFQHLFHKFKQLEKVCFFGDPKQRRHHLPLSLDAACLTVHRSASIWPRRCSSTAEHIRRQTSQAVSILSQHSVYVLGSSALPHASYAMFADRMPIPLGEFISHNVYNSKLKSCHKIDDPSCVVFIDVAKGEEKSCGKSWTVSDLHQRMIWTTS